MQTKLLSGQIYTSEPAEVHKNWKDQMQNKKACLR